MNWALIVQLAVAGLSVATQIGHEVGTVSHTQAASDSVDAASAVAQQVITDPVQQAEAAAAAGVAKSVIGFISLFTSKPKAQAATA